MKLWMFNELVKRCHRIGIYTFKDLIDLKIKACANTNDALMQAVNRIYLRSVMQYKGE